MARLNGPAQWLWVRAMHSYCLVAALLAQAPDSLGPGDHSRSLKVGALERSYLLHVPPGYDARKPSPVVLAFHGATMNAAMMVHFSGLSQKADAANFIVVYPNGTGWGKTLLTWNAGGMVLNLNDDVAFVRDLLDDLAKIVRVDADRVYACGMSNGAMMCYRLAAELSDRIAAVAPVAGTMCVGDCKPARAVPIIHFHGSADTLVPPDGPNQKLPLVIKFQPLEATIKAWVKLNGCDERPQVAELPNRAADMLPVTRKSYNDGKDGAEVVLYLIDGGGHSWPGMNTTPAFLGKTTMNISANDLMWEFFQKHPRKKAAK